MQLRMIAKTEFLNPELYGWTTDVDGGEALVEFAGRACYESWSKPRAETATNKGYMHNIMSQGHFSVLEHPNVSFYITGVSRSLTHELIRHRLFSFSEKSQRFVDVSNVTLIDHPLLMQVTDPDDKETLRHSIRALRERSGMTYAVISEVLEGIGFKGKKVRQAARMAAPESTETRIIVTGNLRAWRHFIKKRASVHADDEIRELAVAIAMELRLQYPNAFQDLVFRTLGTGEEIVETEYIDD